MLSVTESARILGVSTARVRALIAKGVLPAEKAGRAWLLREEDVMQRLSQHAKAGRPRKNRNPGEQEIRTVRSRSSSRTHACEQAHGCEQAQASIDQARDNNYSQSINHAQFHELYCTCKEVFRLRPDAELLTQTDSAEEAAFYVAVADFFLQQRQRQIVKQGVY